MRNKGTAALLAFLLGGIGIHKFYLGRTGRGILYILFCWTFIPAFLGVIEMIIYLSMSEEEFNKKYNKDEIAKYKGMDKYEKMEKLHSLKEKGIIGVEEYEIEIAKAKADQSHY